MKYDDTNAQLGNHQLQQEAPNLGSELRIFIQDMTHHHRAFCRVFLNDHRRRG